MSRVARVETLFPEERYSDQELEMVIQLMIHLDLVRLVLCQKPMRDLVEQFAGAVRAGERAVGPAIRRRGHTGRVDFPQPQPLQVIVASPSPKTGILIQTPSGMLMSFMMPLGAGTSVSRAGGAATCPSCGR
jgi:hypothetical protein